MKWPPIHVGLTLCASHALISPTSAQSAHKASPVAYVRYAQGVILVNGKPSDFSHNRHLYAGWKLICQAGDKQNKEGWIEIAYLDGYYVRLKPTGRTYIVRDIHAQSGKSIWVWAARRQDVSVAFFSPPKEEGVVWPDRFVLRWQPSPGKVRLVLRRADEAFDAEPLWRSPEFDGKNGKLDAPEAREALRKASAARPNAAIKLTLVTANDESEETTFHLLTRAQEIALLKRLTALEAKPEPQRSLLRADAFTVLHLFTEASNAMEDAVNAMPDSVGLRFGAIWAHRRSGNRAAEMQRTIELPPGTHIPGD
jgi:hypothetical protein